MVIRTKTNINKLLGMQMRDKLIFTGDVWKQEKNYLSN